MPSQAPIQKTYRALATPAPELHSFITAFFSPVPRYKRKLSNHTSQSSRSSIPNTRKTSVTIKTVNIEDIVVFADINIHTGRMSRESDDTKEQPFSANYKMKYPQLSHEEDDNYKQFDAKLQETASND